jgi:hypothetical protein
MNVIVIIAIYNSFIYIFLLNKILSSSLNIET